jgi:hypothetical protein
MLPLSPIETMVFYFATIFAARLIATRLPASIAEYVVVGLVFALWYFGPILCGKDWYDFSLLLGAIVGGFGYLAHTRRMGNGDNEQKRADLRWRQIQLSLVLIMAGLIAFVVMLAIGR